ncbi:MAG: phosphoenolpyruvate--protein phosphotransferase [Hyphomicrobiales bacterium]
MPSPVELKGTPASPGVAAGPLVRLKHSREVFRRKAGAPEAEADAFAAAAASAAADLADLMGLSGEEADGILAFQVALLEDDALTGPVQEAISAGASADAAWRSEIERHIGDYESADDEYFRARAGDLRDLRDRVMRHLCGLGEDRLPPGAIVVGDDFAPSQFLSADWDAGGGIALIGSSPSSHVAILARARGVPMVVGLSALPDGHGEAMIDGRAGLVVLSPGSEERARLATAAADHAAAAARAATFLHRPAVTARGTPVKVLVNVGSPADVERIDVSTCDGIGLMRTEFLFHDGHPMPDEETQYRAYRTLLQWAEGRPVTVRTLDAGGDKPIRGYTPDGETNTFLGVRGLRLSLARPDVFRVQLRALARAAVHGNLKVMWPMVTRPEELDEAAALFDAELAALQAKGIAAARPPLGMMVEVPYPALMPERFASAEFLSVGSNDLQQYMAAAARDNAQVAPLAEAVIPGVVKLIRGLTDFGREAGIDVSICGDLASDTRYTEQLVAAGLRSLSVAPAALGHVKAAVSEAEA